MRKTIIFILCLALLTGFSFRLYAQSEKTLDQAELLKQFIGTWKAEIAPDTFIISTNVQSGEGFQQSMKVMTGDQVIYSATGVTGLSGDKKTVISVDLNPEGNVNMQKGRFISKDVVMLEDFGSGGDHALALLEIKFDTETVSQRIKYRGKKLTWEVEWMDPITFTRVE